VIVDGDEDHHQGDADERPHDLLAKQRPSGPKYVAIDEQASDRGDEQRGREQVEIERESYVRRTSLRAARE